MIGETLHQYLAAQCHTITELLPLIHKKADEKAVHKLRVSVKKARACLQLARQLTGHGFNGKKYVQLLKVLHQAAGALRDLHLQQAYLQHYTKSKRAHYRGYHLLLQQHCQLAARQAQAIAGTFPLAFIKELPGRLEKKLDHHAASRKDLSAYLQEQYAAITIPAGNVPAEKWHDLRKQVKRLHYQLEIVQPCFSRQQQPPLEAMLRFTGEAGSRLGDWHDLLAFRQFMKDNVQLMRREKINVPAGTDQLLLAVTGDIRKQLQQCRQWLQQRPAIEW
ncbi:CHAD domain-containing protein [Chitinophaga japonensis]|uniref:CHAD domain-containing protein n=1 Tax=Chitinophaga japonensis TaxID=104662 RepID=A0A562T4R1_CHIJA|nr:CHAD domain-containing protein [Chitinophaga japonensis]TWI88519.1 CHAD domain-containing protein [Chitinophaga japonensis]